MATRNTQEPTSGPISLTLRDQAFIPDTMSSADNPDVVDCVKFQATPSVLMVIFSGHLGSRGLTLTHFKEVSDMDNLDDGSTNANYSSDFSPSAVLPYARFACSSYEDILDAIHGQEMRYGHMLKLASRLRAVVSKNKSVDPSNTPVCVRLTLLYRSQWASGHTLTLGPGGQWIDPHRGTNLRKGRRGE
ncbi:unnamed protein product [Phytophthora fragariaefolia]|uniref:Unnamed protein product n=1 Tax=Phytophthora fragariaefolia TaxID=1490495 RepID=A0A9W6XZ65_9STRA|nr:unnamed protein product [Phytophthora fragariaefolia]